MIMKKTFHPKNNLISSFNHIERRPVLTVIFHFHCKTLYIACASFKGISDFKLNVMVQVWYIFPKYAQYIYPHKFHSRRRLLNCGTTDVFVRNFTNFVTYEEKGRIICFQTIICAKISHTFPAICEQKSKTTR